MTKARRDKGAADFGNPGPDPAKVEVNPGVFREYDIRGVVPDMLSADAVELIGMAIGDMAQAKNQSAVVVGRDGRISSPELSMALVRGLRRTGQDVIDIGMVPTPVLYFATFHLNAGSGVMVTGSHNDPEYNGLKIMLDGATLFGKSIQDICKQAKEGDLARGRDRGKVRKTNVLNAYIQRVKDDLATAPKPKRVAIDAGNGVAGPLAVRLMEALGHEVLPLHCEVDGRFPNHRADPSQPENLSDLVQIVKWKEAAVGFALDGDGDRLGVIDSSGKIIWPDRQLMLLAQDVLARNAGARIIYDVKCSRHLQTVINDAGGQPVMYKTGHSLIKNKMVEESAPLAGEMSGHIFFKERWYGFDDALYTAARMMEIFAKTDSTTAELFATLPEGRATPELRMPLPEDQHAKFMQAIKAKLPMDGAQLITIDGLRLELPSAWGLVRPSNTSPYIILRFEAEDEVALKAIQQRFRAAIKAVRHEAKLPF